MGITTPPSPVLKPDEPQWTTAGIIGAAFGLLVFVVGVIEGFNLILCGMGLLFVAGGYAARRKAPERLCPACRMSVPAAATVCGHCRRELAA